MANRTSRYTDADKANAYLALQVSQGVIREAARNCGIPHTTVKLWKDDWEENGLPSHIQELVLHEADIYISKVKTIRDNVLERLHLLVGDIKSAKEAATVFGILEDKLRLAQGLATSRKETVVQATLPDAAELSALMEAFATSAIEAADQRAGEVVDAEVVLDESTQFRELTEKTGE